MRRPGADEPPCKKKSSWRKKSEIQMLNVNTSQSLLANIREQEIDNENFYASIGGKFCLFDQLALSYTTYSQYFGACVNKM